MELFVPESQVRQRAALERDALRQSEMKFRDFVESATIAVHFVGPDGAILWANQAELDLLGYSREEYVGRHLSDFHVDARVIGDILDRLKRGERLREYEARLRTKSGDIRHVLIDSSALFEDGKFVHTRCFTRDITEKRRAEQALRESEQRFRVITEASPIMVWMSGPDKLCYYFSKGWLEFVGRTLEQEAGNGWAENVHPDDFDRCLQIYVSRFDARRPFEMEYRLRHHTGQYRWILDHGVPRYTPDGKFEGYVGGCLDIHDQKEAAEKVRIAAETLRQSEEEFRSLANAIPQLAWMANPDGWIFWYNRRWYDYTGTTPEQMKGWGWQSVHDPAVLPSVLQRWKASIASGDPFEMTFPLRGADGMFRPFLTRILPIRDQQGEIRRWFGTNTDISGEVQAREQLQRNQERLEAALVASQRLAAIVESSDDAIVSKDLNGIVTSWNRCAERIFGYTAEEMIGRPITTIIPPELQQDEQRILATIARGERIEHFETVRMTKSGKRIEVSLTISPVKDQAGRIVGAAKIARDITQQKKVERALQTTERLASVGRLAATVAHEINNPLEAVTNLVYLAKECAVRKDVRDYLAGAEEELDRISHLAKQTLGFCRETRGVSAIQVGAIVNSLISVFASRTRNKEIDVRLEVRQDPEINAVSDQIRQLVANLLSNSIDAVGGGGRIRIRVSAGAEWKGERKSGLRLTVADSGSGIPAADRSKLFEPFFTTKKEVGTGLGLWVCKNIVENHHGSIRVKSSALPGRSGTVFSVFLPALPQPSTIEERFRQAV